jgi:hypothetical protein
MTTGHVFAERPRSASQTSPGWGFIEEVEHFLLDLAGASQVQRVGISRCDDLFDASLDFPNSVWPPLSQFLVELFCHGCHDL